MSEGLAPIRGSGKAKNGETPGVKNFTLLGIPTILHSVILRFLYWSRLLVSRCRAGHEEVSAPANLQVGGIHGTDQRESLSDGRDFVAGRGLLDRVGRNFAVSEDR